MPTRLPQKLLFDYVPHPIRVETFCCKVEILEQNKDVMKRYKKLTKIEFRCDSPDFKEVCHEQQSVIRYVLNCIQINLAKQSIHQDEYEI